LGLSIASTDAVGSGAPAGAAEQLRNRISADETAIITVDIAAMLRDAQ
jgi:hypothetical protein